jgi:hypothetical protein
MRKMSEIMIELATEIMAKPVERTSNEGCHAALMLASVAWNRAIDRTQAQSQGNYMSALAVFERGNPRVRDELISHDYEEMIDRLYRAKLERYPSDNRFITVCGTTPSGNVHVEWTPREIKTGSGTHKG